MGVLYPRADFVGVGVSFFEELCCLKTSSPIGWYPAVGWYPAATIEVLDGAINHERRLAGDMSDVHVSTAICGLCVF
jgi:hypothetical protein